MMDIKQQIQEHTFLAYKLAYEKTKLLDRLAKIDSEIIHYDAVVNALRSTDTVNPVELENGAG